MTYETNYLAHHGIKGQKWGVRRFQNSDGTLTSAGRARTNKLERKQEKAQLKKDMQAYRKALMADEAINSRRTAANFVQGTNVSDFVKNMNAKKGPEYTDKVMRNEHMRPAREVAKGVAKVTAISAGTAAIVAVAVYMQSSNKKRTDSAVADAIANINKQNDFMKMQAQGLAAIAEMTAHPTYNSGSHPTYNSGSHPTYNSGSHPTYNSGSHTTTVRRKKNGKGVDMRNLTYWDLGKLDLY